MIAPLSLLSRGVPSRQMLLPHSAGKINDICSAAVQQCSIAALQQLQCMHSVICEGHPGSDALLHSLLHALAPNSKESAQFQLIIGAAMWTISPPPCLRNVTSTTLSPGRSSLLHSISHLICHCFLTPDLMAETQWWQWPRSLQAAPGSLQSCSCVEAAPLASLERKETVQ